MSHVRVSWRVCESLDLHAHCHGHQHGRAFPQWAAHRLAQRSAAEKLAGTQSYRLNQYKTDFGNDNHNDVRLPLLCPDADLVREISHILFSSQSTSGEWNVADELAGFARKQGSSCLLAFLLGTL